MLRTENRKLVSVNVGLKIELDGPATNISEGGFRLILNHPLPTGSPVRLSFRLSGDRELIECQGRIIWCSESRIAPAVWDVGVKFVDLSAEQQAKIREFIEQEELPPAEPADKSN